MEFFMRFFGGIRGKARRAWLCLFRPGYVKQSTTQREGFCNQCGNCCRIAFSCPFLKIYKSHALCRIYHIGRPSPCVAFPINRDDLADVGFECTYTFPADVRTRRPSTVELPVWNPASLTFNESGSEFEEG
ncbi:MAG: hypothetical protein M1313_04200 [Nitrospirae bacterium]|nr:hypothetical protein [Nitrospirota bacterium]